ncbi:cell wall-binding repeat-containing protein [Clostridium botulinum]|uniref:cell wall-binding repeat-containing protein n=1 Tax=Clostridium botulinum TaxID=1491 RepID=UPI002491B124|nr:cell wall-binding repeat-containing protein [Clostridium botulinum]BDB00309.1 cell surface protein [Clostridium botulinum]
MNKKGTRALASATVVGLVLATVATGNVKAAPGDVNKVQGNDRYETAANVAKANWKDGAKDVIIASGNGYADSLSASVLAKKLNAPIILTTAGELNSNAKSALQTLKPENVYVIGGNASVSQAVRDGLKKDYKVTELGGKTRFETNLAVANHLVDKLGVKADNVMVVNGQDGFSDALSAAPVAAAKEQVLLIVGRDASTADLAANFVKKHNSKVTVIGTEGVVPTAVYNKLGASERVNGGADRFDTNLKIMEHFKLNADNIYVANATDGQNGYADALVASALAGKSGAPLVLVDTKDAQGTKNAIKYIADNKTDKTEVSTVGGSGVMPDEIVNEIETAVNPELSAAEKAVKAYEDAKIGTSEEIAAAKALKADAVKAVDNVKDATKKSAFEARIAVKDKAISDAEAKLGVRVESVEASNLNQIKVVFTQKVKAESAEDVENYKLAGDKLTKGDDTAKLLDDDKTVVITLKDAKNQNTTKKFEVKDNVIQQKDSGKTVSAFEQDITFKDLTAPTVEKVTMDGAKTLKITFSEGVKVGNATASENYKIDGQSISSFGVDITAMNKNKKDEVPFGGITNEVKIEFDSPIDAGKHTLTIGASTSKEILDSQNFALQKIDMPFTVNDVKSEPKIVSATGKVNGEVTLEFNVKMDEGSIDPNGRDFLYGTNSAYKAELDSDDPDDKTVKVYFKETFDEGANVLKILQGKLKDVYGNRVAPDDDKRISFTVSKDDTAPVLKDAYAVSERKIRLVFSKSIEDEYFKDMESNGSIKLKNSDGDTEYGGDKNNKWESVKLVDNHSNEIELTMPENSNYARLGKANYDIVVKDICDKSGNEIEESKKTITTIDNTDPNLRNWNEKDANKQVNLLVNKEKETAKVLFNEPMDKDSIGELSNYLYDTGDGFKKLPSGSSITVANDGKAATINFPKDTVKPGWIGNATVRVMNVKDAAGNVIDGNVATTFKAQDATKSEEDAPDFIDNLTVYGNDNEVWAEVSVNDNIDTLDKEDFKLSDAKVDEYLTISPSGSYKPKSVVRNGKKLTITWDNKDAIKAFKAAGKKIRIPSDFKAKTTANEEGIKLIATDNYDAEDKIAPELVDKADPQVVISDSKTIKINFNEVIKNNAAAYEDDFTISVGGKSVDSDDIKAKVDGSTIELKITDEDVSINGNSNVTVKFKSNVDIKDEAGNLFVPSTDEKTGNINIVNEVKSDVTTVTVVSGQEAVVTNVDKTNHKISVANATKVDALKAAIKVEKGSVKVYTNDTKATEATGADEVTNDMVVEAIAEDGTAKQVYTIEVAAAPKSNVTTVEVVSGQEAVVTGVDTTNHKITVAKDTTVEALKAAIKVEKGSVKVYTDDTKVTEATGTDKVTSTMIVEAIAEDGTTKEVYKIEVTA